MGTFVKGRRTGLFVSAPAPHGQAASKPTPVTLTVQAYRPAGSQSLPMRTASGAHTIPAGTLLQFGTALVIVTKNTELRDNLTRDLPVTNTGHPRTGTPIALSIGASTAWDGLLRVNSTSDTELQINSTTQDATSVIYDDAARVPWVETTVTSKNWSLPRSGRFRPTDPAFLAVEQATLEAREVFVQRTLPDENGNPANIMSGRAHITNFNVPAAADGIIDASWVFAGKGKLSKSTPPPIEPPPGVMLDFSKSSNAINLVGFL